MELTLPPISLPALPRRTLSTPNPSLLLPLRSFASFPSAKPLASLSNPGWLRCGSHSVRAMATDEAAPKSMEEAPERTEEEREYILDEIKIKLESEDTFNIFIYGTSALVALWIISVAIVGALDSVPLLPKLMEVVGLGFSVWFGFRYLFFKENRDELLEKLRYLKEQLIGPAED